MKRHLLKLALVLLALSMTSCGLPQVLGRTIGNSVRQVGALGNSR